MHNAKSSILGSLDCREDDALPGSHR